MEVLIENVLFTFLRILFLITIIFDKDNQAKVPLVKQTCALIHYTTENKSLLSVIHKVSILNKIGTYM